MACFIVPGVEAVIVKTAENRIRKKEQTVESEVKIPLSVKLKWLEEMLFGGCALLLFEHIWHGEIVPYFPFLTAMSNPADMMEMFKEMATVGVTMTAVVTVAWLGICRVADALVSKKSGEKEA